MEFIAESNFMSKFFETRKDRLYAGVTTVGSIAAGAIPFAVLGSSTILLDIGITVTALVGSVLFRPRSDAEIKMLLGKSAMIDEIKEVAATPVASAKTRKEAEKKLIAVMDKVLRVKTALGTEIIDAVTPIFENLSVITKKWDALEGYAEVRYTVETMMDDYLPTSVQSYLNIPTKGDAKLAAKLKADLLDQLGILEAETAKIRKNLLADDIQDFNVQGNFLKSRFQQSDTTNMLTMSSNTTTAESISSPMTVRVPVSSQSDNLNTRISIGPRS
jgi:hypothetical protein